MEIKNLEFFDKNGYNLNLNWNKKNKIWEGNIFFPKVSVGLYENTTIYVAEYIGEKTDCESCGDSDCKDDVYSYPTGRGNIVFQWDLANKFVDEFFMFNFDEDYVLKDTSSLVNTAYDGPLCETLIINRFDTYNVPLLDSSRDFEQDDLLEIHVAFMANDQSAETTYRRTLVMTYENGYERYDIARITFYAETIEEDERLKTWNENLGYNLKPEDTIIFKNSDIHEYMSDFKILNEKRKELMLEGHNIYPYIGSYKAILNAIKFFGYDNLNIVEYWRNINDYDIEFGKIYRTYVYSIKDRKTLSTKRKPISLNTKDFRKLNDISLVYNFNHPEKVDGIKYDEYGLPNVIEDFDKDKRDDFVLTIEEALIKLFALKKKLNDEFTPSSTKIKDVIGEGHYFGINLIGNNPQISSVNYVESKGYVDFSVFPDRHCYLTEDEDFERYIANLEEINVDKTVKELGDKTIEDLKKEYDENSDGDVSISEIDKRSLGGLINRIMKEDNRIICGHYESYYNETNGNNFSDADEYGMRDVPKPRNVYKDVVTDDVNNDPYGKNEYVPDMTVSAKVLLKGEFSDNIEMSSIIEWKITHPEKKWKKEYYGEVNEFDVVFVQLPYLGNYDVEMTVWDIYNHCCKKFTKDAIIVEPYNIDIRGFYLDARPLPDNLKYDMFIPQEYLDDVEKSYTYYLWTKEENNVKKGVVTNKRNPREIEIDNVYGEYIINGDVSEELKGLNNIKPIDDKGWICVSNTENDGDDVLKFSWINITEDDNVSHGVDEFTYECILDDVPFDENDSYVPEWNSDEMYHVIKNNVDTMYSYALQEHLNIDEDNTSMRNYRHDGSVSFKGPYYKFDVDTILYRVERGYKEYDHLNAEIVNLEPGEHYKYVRYINSVVDIKPLTWVMLGFDYTRITGRVINNEYPKWTLTMTGDELDPDENFKQDKVVATHNGLYFTYLFEDEGSYKIKLEMIDINNNKYEFEKPIVIVDKNANYEMYHTLKYDYEVYLEEKNNRGFIKN